MNGHNTSLSINGQEIASGVKMKLETTAPPEEFTPISPSNTDQSFLETKKEIEQQILKAMCVPQYVVDPPPEWVRRIIRIPQRRIDQILGRE